MGQRAARLVPRDWDAATGRGRTALTGHTDVVSDCAISPNWKVRFRENQQKMQSGDLLKAAEVFKSLLQVQIDKPLSFHEKGVLDRARHMLVSEISTVRNVPG